MRMTGIKKEAYFDSGRIQFQSRSTASNRTATVLKSISILSGIEIDFDEKI